MNEETEAASFARLDVLINLRRSVQDRFCKCDVRSLQIRQIPGFNTGTLSQIFRFRGNSVSTFVTKFNCILHPLPFLFVLGFNTGTLSQIFRFKKIEIASQISILALSPVSNS
jgi:hypothetical protein